MEFHRLQREYTQFVDEFIRWANLGSAVVHFPLRSRVNVSNSDDGKLIVESLFHLQDWPFKGATRKVRSSLSMLLRTREVYDANYVLIKSNVNTIYFKPTKKELPARPHTAIHYDYEFQMDDAHPVFHAQFGAREIPADELSQVNFDRALDLSAFDGIRSIRIPTVHVGLPAALLAVTADHLSRDAYNGFLEYVAKNRFFNEIASIRLDKCRVTKLHNLDQWVYRSHNIYM